MKKLLTIVLAFTLLYGCNPKEKKTTTTNPLPPINKVDTIPQPKVDTTKHPLDDVKENPEMDRRAKEELTQRRFPKKPRPGDPPPPPPPPPAGQGTACLLLDFDGHLVSGTMWNTNGDIICTHSGLDATGQQNVLNRIKSYFAFDDSTLITTDESVFYQYSQNKRRRIVFTEYNEWYSNSAGGVAYINSLTWFDETPAFVFTKLHGYNQKNIADAGAHEGGHCFGCRHRSDWVINPDNTCTKRNEYLWGPDIMGASYYEPSPLFTTGVSSICCTCIQDARWIIENTRRM